MGDEVALEIVPDDGSLLSNELLLDIVVVDHSRESNNRALITTEEFRISRGLLTSEKSSKSLVLHLLSETVLPECYYPDGIVSEVVEKIRRMMLKSLSQDRIQFEVVKKIQNRILQTRYGDDANVNDVLPHMSIHIILYRGSCKYCVINGARFISRFEVLCCVYMMCRNGLGECIEPSLSRPKKRVKIQSEEGSCLDCSICLQEIGSENEATGLPCLHVYHRTGIAKWFQRSCACLLCRSKASLFPKCTCSVGN